MYSTKAFQMESGERYCLLVDASTGMPCFFPNLYVTTQIRNQSLSLSAMESALSAIGLLLIHAQERGIDLERRFRQGELLTVSEQELIRHRVQLRLVKNERFGKRKDKYVSPRYEYVRLTEVAYYLKWLANELVPNSKAKSQQHAIEKMCTSILSARPIRSNDEDERLDKSLSDKQSEVLASMFSVGAESNPFVGEGLQYRNWLIYLLLFSLGLRRGELLNIHMRDVDFSASVLHIRRRADSQDDNRLEQPLVKTQARSLHLSAQLVRAIQDYVMKYRHAVPGARKHGYLFVTHKAGPTQGKPMTLTAYKKLMKTICDSSTLLKDFSGHDLRHHWNYQFSEVMDNAEPPISEAEQEKQRSYLMGWKEGSGTARIYNKRFIRKKSNEASLVLQKNAFKMPKGIKE
nr:site-specific integrase [Pseudomonas sp. A46]